MSKRGKNRRVWPEKLAAALLFACVALLAVGALRLRALHGEYAAGAAAYEEVARRVRPAQTPAPEALPASQAPIETPPPGPQVDFAALSAINPDAVAWLAIDGTDVSYPVVQGADNKKYLKTLFTGERNRAGCLFLDCGNSGDFSDRNNVVYGHSLNDGTMFTQLLQYKDQAFFDAHPTGWLVTPEKRYEIRFFSGFVSDVWGDAWTLSPDGAWARQMAEQSCFTGGPTPTSGDKILTLSTCSYEFSGARFLLLGVLEEV